MKPHPWIESKSTWILLAILGVAAFLRLYGIDYGLPQRYYPDEAMEVHRALKLGAGQWDWDLDRTMKGFYFYILFAEYGIYFLILSLLGKIHGAGEFALRFAVDPTPFYLMGRVTTALMGTATVGVLYALARRMGGAAASRTAALFLAVTVPHVFSSHSITLDVPLTFFSTLSFCFMLALTEQRTWKNYLLCGLFATLATLTKINMALLFVPFAAAHFWPRPETPRPSLRSLLFHRKMLATLAGCLALYLLANPGIVVNAGEFLQRMNIFFGSAKVPDQFVLNYAGTEISGLRFYAETFFKASGVGIASLGAGGMIVALVSGDRRHWIFLGFFFLFVGVLSQAKGMFSHRYVLPLLPLLSLYAGLLFARIFEIVKAGKAAVFLAALLLCLEPFSRSLADDILCTRKDTRTLALEWFESNVPPGSRVLIHGNRTFPNLCTVPLRPSTESVQESISRYDRAGDDKGLLLRRFLEPSLEGATYYLILTGDHREKRSFEEYRALGMQYAVICDCEDDLFLSPVGRKNFPEIADMYLQLMDPSHSTELVRWERSEQRPGPTIRIYGIRDPIPSPREETERSHDKAEE